MNVWTTAAAALVLMAVAGDTEAIRKDKKAMQGAWKVIASQQDGERVPPDDLKDLFLIFKGDSILIREGGKTDEKSRSRSIRRRAQRNGSDDQFGPNKEKIDRAHLRVRRRSAAHCIQSNKEAPRHAVCFTVGGKLWLVTLQKSTD